MLMSRLCPKAGRTHTFVELVPKSSPILMRVARGSVTVQRSAGNGIGGADWSLASWTRGLTSSGGAVDVFAGIGAAAAGLEAFGVCGGTVGRREATGITGRDLL